ncbi:MAG TPA: Druantia anti-phage system protein DruA, partial [Dongiaceae bacterium]|nr:Druantia anti-phage system protein DruA [Dongiaceae bacterium]
MTTVLSYRGRDVTDADVAFIRDLIAANPAASRRALSLKLCEAWAWVQPNGRPRDMVCRSMLIALDRAGAVRLPAPKKRAPISQRIRPRPARCDLLRWSPIEGPLAAIRPLEFRQVRRTAEETLFGSLIETHHYLGYVQPVGEHLKYMVFSHGAPVACLAFSSAPRHLGPRDRFVGWSPEARRRNIRLVAYNARYLILPWVRVPHLTSHILGLVARRISGDWEALYAHP